MQKQTESKPQSKSEATPGPWVVQQQDPYSCIWILGTEAVNTFVAKAEEPMGAKEVSRGTRMANARLIAAAPALLEACKEALYHLEQGDDEPEDNMTADRIEARDVVRAAIARAKGE